MSLSKESFLSLQLPEKAAQNELSSQGEIFQETVDAYQVQSSPVSEVTVRSQSLKQRIKKRYSLLDEVNEPSPQLSSLIQMVTENKDMYIRRIIRRGGSSDEAEDIYQNANIKAIVYLNQYDSDKGSLEEWYSIILKNETTDQHRKNIRRPVSASRMFNEINEELPQQIVDTSADSNLDDLIEQNELKAILIERLGKLDEKKRRLIVLNFFGEYSHGEIAKSEDIPIGTIKTRIRSGLHELSEDEPIQQYWEVFSGTTSEKDDIESDFQR